MRSPIVTDVKVVPPYGLEVWFDDGQRRLIDAKPLLFGPVFEPLREPRAFAKAAIDPELGTVVWPNGADLSPEFLYAGDESVSS